MPNQLKNIRNQYSFTGPFPGYKFTYQMVQFNTLIIYFANFKDEIAGSYMYIYYTATT